MNVTSAPAIQPNPFNMQPRTLPASGEFDEQLATALSDSLRRLGVEAGEVSITIRQGVAASARQILITYNAPTDPVSPAVRDANPATAGGPNALVEPAQTSWCAYDGPRDRRDAVADGGGRVTASGAPDIQVNANATPNQYNYSGPGAFNPYFTTPSNPLRAGYVLGFSNWFRDATVYGGITGPMPANRAFFATAEGAQEALRLVQQYEPQAQLTEVPWGGGPFSATNTMYYVQLPGDRLMNAGLVLHGYYNGGSGVCVESDVLLASAFKNA